MCRSDLDSNEGWSVWFQADHPFCFQQTRFGVQRPYQDPSDREQVLGRTKHWEWERFDGQQWQIESLRGSLYRAVTGFEFDDNELGFTYDLEQELSRISKPHLPHDLSLGVSDELDEMFEHSADELMKSPDRFESCLISEILEHNWGDVEWARNEYHSMIDQWLERLLSVGIPEHCRITTWWWSTHASARDESLTYVSGYLISQCFTILHAKLATSSQRDASLELPCVNSYS